MVKFCTKAFEDWQEIDHWLKSFGNPATNCSGMVIEGYFVVDNRVVITVSRLEYE